MEEVAKFLEEVMRSFGFWGVINVLIISIIAQLVKIPLKKYAEKWSHQNKTEKSVITKYFAFLPYVFSLIATFIFYSWKELGWDMESFSWTTYLSEVVTFGSLAVALYEIISLVKKSIVAKAANATGLDTSTTSSSEIMAAYNRLNTAKKKALKAENSELNQKSKVAKKAAKIAKLNAQIEKLNKEVTK